MSTKERNAIDLLCVSTVGEFLDVDLRRVFDLRGFGTTTYAKLKKSRDTLRALVLPQNTEGDGGDHCRYDEDDISTLGLSLRGLKALRRLKVNTARSFLLLDLATLGHLSNCGAVTTCAARRRLFFATGTTIAAPRSVGRRCNVGLLRCAATWNGCCGAAWPAAAAKRKACAGSCTNIASGFGPLHDVAAWSRRTTPASGRCVTR